MNRRVDLEATKSSSQKRTESRVPRAKGDEAFTTHAVVSRCGDLLLVQSSLIGR